MEGACVPDTGHQTKGPSDGLSWEQNIGFVMLSCLQQRLSQLGWSSRIPAPRTACCPTPGPPVSTQPSVVIPFEQGLSAAESPRTCPSGGGPHH